MPIETAVYLEDILSILGWSRRKFFRRREELVSCGAIFYRRQGRPPKKRICAFPSTLMIWAQLKATKGEMI